MSYTVQFTICPVAVVCAGPKYEPIHRRLAQEPHLRADLETARQLGIPYTTFLSWPQYDRDLYRALHDVETDAETHRCPVCGGDARECQDPANQRAYEATFTRCFRTKAIGQAMKTRGEDDDSKALAASTRFHPERVKTT